MSIDPVHEVGNWLNWQLLVPAVGYALVRWQYGSRLFAVLAAVVGGALVSAVMAWHAFGGAASRTDPAAGWALFFAGPALLIGGVLGGALGLVLLAGDVIAARRG